MTRVTGVIIRKVHSGTDFQDKFEVQVLSPGLDLSFRAVLLPEIIAFLHAAHSIFRCVLLHQIGQDGRTQIFDSTQLLKFQHYEVSWQKGKLIGKGGYGKVYNGLNTKDGKHIAIKEMELGMLRKKV